MSAQAGIHDLLLLDEGKSWMPACAGMTWTQRRWMDLYFDRYYFTVTPLTAKGPGFSATPETLPA